MNFCLFVSSATGISCLIRSSLGANFSFSKSLFHAPNQISVTLHFYSFIHLKNPKLTETGVIGAHHLQGWRSLFVIAVSPVRECSITPRASIFFPDNVETISVYSSVLCAKQPLYCGERSLQSAPFVYITALARVQCWVREQCFLFILLLCSPQFSCPFSHNKDHNAICLHDAESLLEFWEKNIQK